MIGTPVSWLTAEICAASSAFHANGFSHSTAFLPARHAAIIFGRAEQDAVGGGDLFAEPGVGRRLFGQRVILLIVEREVADLDHRAVETIVADRANGARHLAVDAVGAKAADEDRDFVVGHDPQTPLPD